MLPLFSFSLHPQVVNQDSPLANGAERSRRLTDPVFCCSCLPASPSFSDTSIQFSFGEQLFSNFWFMWLGEAVPNPWLQGGYLLYSWSLGMETAFQPQ